MSTSKRWILRWAMPAVLLLGSVGASQAVTLLSNLPATSAGTGSNLGLSPTGVDRAKGVGLTMGATDIGFESLQALVSNTAATAVDAAVSGGIFSSFGGDPGVMLAAFMPVMVLAGAPAAEVTLTTAAPFMLLANTSYWFVIDGPDTANLLRWDNIVGGAAPTGFGVSFDGYRFSSSGGVTWANSSAFNGVQINAVPETSTLLMFAAGLTLLGARLRRR